MLPIKVYLVRHLVDVQKKMTFSSVGIGMTVSQTGQFSFKTRGFHQARKGLQ